MMHLVPSITITKGRTARLEKGDESTEKIYEDSPLNVAIKFEEHGARRLHIVDLDGARKGAIVNYPSLELIKGHTNLRVNYTGGLHTDGDVIKAFEAGAESVTAATIPVYNKDLFFSWIMSYGREKIAMGADNINGMIRVGGWQKDTKIDMYEHIQFYFDRGLKYIKVTDISRDGVLEGPNFDMVKDLIKRFPDICFFVSGGVRNIDDVYRLEDLGAYGTIFARAYYEGKISLKELEGFYARKI